MINFNSNLTNKILGYYLLNDKKRHYLRELAKIFSVDPGNLSRHLSELEKEGIIESEISGQQKYFFLNAGYPLLNEVKRIYEAKFSLPLLLKETLSHLNGLKEVYIFGSYAKNSLEADSDIDVLLIGSHDALAARKAVLPLQKRLGREINMIDFSEREYGAKKDEDEFLIRVFKDPLIKVL